MNICPKKDLEQSNYLSWVRPWLGTAKIGHHSVLYIIFITDVYSVERFYRF